jgi:Domain of unknown function (DUF4157)
MFAFDRKQRPSSAHSPAAQRPAVGRAVSDADVGAELSPPVATGSGFDFASIPIMPPLIRRKVTIGSPQDPFEREADEVADKVMGTAQRSPIGSELHRAKAEAGQSRALAPPVVHEVLARPGRPLEQAARDAMEGRFGADFSSVRVHDDARAAESARAVGAHAYSVGSDVVFAAGRYGPGTAAGDRLLAHELAHTLQGGAATLRRQPSGGQPLGGPLLDPGTDDPQSLKGSINDSDPQRVRTEVAAIRRWLARQPAGTDDTTTQHLRSELARLEARLGLDPAPHRTTAWDGFAPSFNTEFADVLNVFGVPVAPLTAARLQALFTDTQRQKLQDFIITRRIPDRLFNSTDIGTTTAQQRLLLSAHILAKGVYRPGSFDQRVHAQFCFHWVQIVHHYAGATPPGAGFAGGVMGTFDPKGAAVITTGQEIDVFNPKRVARPDLPTEESPAGEPANCATEPPDSVKPPICGPGLGPLHEGTSQAEAADAAEAADPGKGARFYRQPQIAFAEFDKFQTGDWLYMYNANASEGGGHSVIFSHWKTGNLVHASGARYRVAVVWSQPRPESGGLQHEANLGDQFVKNPANKLAPFVTPVTHVSRVTPDTGPATTAAGMLPSPTGAAATAVAKANEDFIKAKKLKRPVNRNRLKQWLRDKNESFMGSLGAHLDPGQHAVLHQVNLGGDLEVLVRLYQRMRTLNANAKLLDEKMRAYYEKLDPMYKTAKEKKDAAAAAAAADLRVAEAEIKSMESDLPRNDPARIRELDAAVADVDRAISNTKDDRERKDLRDQREHLRARADAARAVQQRNVDLRAGREKALKAGEAAKAIALPFGVVHPGDLSKEVRGRTTGKLADINADIEWDKLVDPAPSAPPTTTPKKP